jgi:uncharacterized protein (TIGR00251 family)
VSTNTTVTDNVGAGRRLTRGVGGVPNKLLSFFPNIGGKGVAKHINLPFMNDGRMDLYEVSIMTKDAIKISAKVSPGARKSTITSYADDVLRLKIAAPPVEGKANKELIAYLSDVLGVSQSVICIEKGLTSRNKLVSIAGMDKARFDAIIGDILRSGTQDKLL